MPDGIRLLGFREVRADLRRLERDAPKLLNRTIKTSLTQTVLPKVKDRAPKGKTGKLAARNRVVVAGANIGIANSLPYANAEHWGRFFWPNKEAPNRRRSPVKGVPFIWDTVEEERGSVLRDIDRAIQDGFDAVS